MMSAVKAPEFPACTACGAYFLRPVHDQRQPQTEAEHLNRARLTVITTRYMCRNCGRDRTADWETYYGWA